MSIAEIAAAGFSIAGLIFLMMAALLLTRWRDRSKSPIIALAAFFSAVWAITQAGLASGFVVSPSLFTAGSELLRCVAWASTLALILRSLVVESEFDAKARRYFWLLLIASVGGSVFGVMRTTIAPVDVVTIVNCLVLGGVVVILCEQTSRHVPLEADSSLQYFCLGVAGIFIYDMVFFGRILFEGEQNNDVWAARGFVNSLLSVPIFYAVRRRLSLSLDTLVPRQYVFYSFGLIAVGVFLCTMYAGNYFISRHGGQWSEVLQILFVVAILVLMCVLLVSRSIRAKARVYVTKALFQYKYDYRREWLRFIATLSQSGPDQHVPTKAVRAIAQIVNSPGGVVWTKHGVDEDYVPVGAWNCELPANLSVDKDSSLVKFLSESEWVIDLDEMTKYPSRYGGQGQDDLPDSGHHWWLIVPMLLGEGLSGFLTLLRPGEVPVLNFEDHDLLKTAGRHVATHIEQAETDRRLAEASQFGAYNRLTAFLMHDLSNLLAQQSLVVENAERFGHNPEFIDDAISTISHSVTRMRRLMGQLTSGSKPPTKTRVNLCSVVQKAVESSSARRPLPSVIGCNDDIYVQADAERLSMVIEHLIRNAQEATLDHGQVTIEASSGAGTASIAIVDTGCGMTQDFIRNRLFRPFDSTKGSQGMGIGVYQARDYVRSLDGQLEVSSAPGIGTTFVVRFPLHQ